jgi:hypothetical protein
MPGMRKISLLALIVVPALAGCALTHPKVPGPYADAPSLVNVAALTKFDGQLPLVIIPANAADWGPSLSYAVKAALKIKPTAQFRVALAGPPAAIPSVTEEQLAPLAPEAALVADAIVADGVATSNVSLAGPTTIAKAPAPTGPEIVVLAK